MRTITGILLALAGLHAFAEERTAPLAYVVNGNGTAPLAGAFLPHPGSTAASLILAAEKRIIPPEKPGRLLIIGEGRREEVSARPASESTFAWRPAAHGYIAELEVGSPGAAAVRVALAFEAGDAVEIRVGSRAAWGGDSPAVVLGSELVAKLRDGNDGPLWTPVTSGDTQFIQLVSMAPTPPAAVRVVNVSHLWLDPAVAQPPEAQPKYLAACQQNYSCATDATIKESGKAVARLLMDHGDGTAGLCSGSLLNDRGSTGNAWFTTAAHCLINTQSVAASVQFFWFYETACGGSGTIPAASSTVGAQLMLWASDIDFNFLKVTGPLPSGVVRLGWSTNEMANGTGVFGVHHPSGHQKSYSTGTKQQDQTVSFAEPGFNFDVYSTVVHWGVGLTEQGSSGSPLMTTDGAFRGTLSAGPINQACNIPTSFTAYYAKFTSAYPRIRDWIDPGSSNVDDRPDAATQVTSTLSANTAQSGVLNSSTDQDWFKFSITEAGVWLVYSTVPAGATTDTFGRMYGSNGTTLIDSNDDDPTGTFGLNFLLGAHFSGATTAYVQVTGAAGSTGPYEINTLFIPDDDHSGFPSFGSTLAPNGSDTGIINPGGDSDYFIVNVTGAGTLKLESTGSTDLVGRLYDANFNLVGQNDDVSYPSNLNFRIQVSVTPGKYYLKVVGYDPTTTGNYTVRSTFTPLSSGAGNAKTLGSRATVSPTRTLYGGFEVTSQSLVYILVRGNSLGTLGVTQAYLDAPRVRLYNAQGQDIITDQGGRPGFNMCSSTISSAAPVVSYYQNTRGQPVQARDACIAQTLAPGAYTFSVTPSIPGVTTSSTTSAPDTGEVLFEVILGGGTGAAAKSLGSRATVTGAATMYGGFEISQAMKVYILVRGNSLGTLGVTQAFLDAPRVRFYNAQGQDLLTDTNGNPGFNFCQANPLQQPVLDFYRITRGQPADGRDACVAQNLTPGAYTFSVTPTGGTGSSGEVLFEVTLGPP